MEQVQKLFNYNENPIRTILKDGEAWFIAKDVSGILGYANAPKMTRNLDDDEKLMTTMWVGGQNREVSIINESGLFSAILSSRKQEAKQFKRWVTHEVLPTIRKHGAYMTDAVLERTLKDPDYMIGLLENLKEEKQKRLALEKQAEEDRPKVTYFETILASNNAVNITQIAKDYGLGASALNRILEEAKVQYRQNGQWLLYSKYQNRGFTKSRTIMDATDTARMHTRWTQKGRLFIHELLAKRGIVPVSDVL
jgi:anti-repressor protein